MQGRLQGVLTVLPEKLTFAPKSTRGQFIAFARVSDDEVRLVS